MEITFFCFSVFCLLVHIKEKLHCIFSFNEIIIFYLPFLSERNREREREVKRVFFIECDTVFHGIRAVTMASADQASSISVLDPVDSSDSNDLNPNPYSLKTGDNPGSILVTELLIGCVNYPSWS